MQKGVITRFDLRNHEYKDVTHSPIEEFDSASSKDIEKAIGKGIELRIYGASCKFESLRP